MKQNPLAAELNETLRTRAPHVLEMLSGLGRDLYYPKGILTQTAEAKQKAKRINATIGIAKEGGEAMHLPAVMKSFAGLRPDDVLPYAPTTGLPELRDRWRAELFQKNPSLKGHMISLPLLTAGVTHGLSLVADLFVESGDAVLMPDKVWGNYNMIFGVRRGGEPAKYPLLSGAGGFDVEGFRKALKANAGRGKLVVILNFPNNPTGYSVTPAEADGIAEAIREIAQGGCNVVAVCDDAYFGLFYDDACLKESVFTRLAGLHERVVAIKLDGATKEDFVWGLRVAFLTYALSPSDPAVYEALEKKNGGAIRGSVSNTSMASQSVVLRAMNDPLYEKEGDLKFAILKARAAKVKAVLAQERYTSVWTPYPFNSGYFMCLKMKGLNAEAYRVRLLEKHGIGVISTSDTDIRVAFSCVEEARIPELFEAMFECAREMTPQAVGR